MDRPASSYHPPTSSADAFRTESIAGSVESKAKKGFFGRSKDIKEKAPKPVKERAKPIPFVSTSSPVPHFIYGNGRPIKVRAPLGSTPLSPAVSTRSSGGISTKSAGIAERSEANDHFGELPVHDKRPIIAATRTISEEESRAIKNARRQSLPPQASFSSPLMSQVSSRPTHARRPSDGAITKHSLPPVLATRPESVMGSNTFDLTFPDENRRRNRSSAESTLSAGSSLISGRGSDMWSHASAASSMTSLAPTIQASSILDLKDMQIAPKEHVPVYNAECQSAFDSATRNLAKILGLSLCYLVAIDVSQLPTLPSVALLSTTGPTVPPPSFDPKLHFEALRAPERGLLYQRNRASAATLGHQAGMLVPVIEFQSIGYVLCAFTDKVERSFDDRDVKYLRRFGVELEKWVVKGQ
ncbi:hypothetical protein RQP46_007698 [Phenoliferia psychrophenolica]